MLRPASWTLADQDNSTLKMGYDFSVASDFQFVFVKSVFLILPYRIVYGCTLDVDSVVAMSLRCHCDFAPGKGPDLRCQRMALRRQNGEKNE